MPCCINYSDSKSKECVIIVISIASAFWVLHSMMTHKPGWRRGSWLWEKSKQFGCKKKKSIKNQGLGEIKSFETTGDISNQPQPDRLRKTTAVDDRLKLSKRTLKYVSVKSPTTSRKLGWCSDNLLATGDWHEVTEATHQDTNLWSVPQIERQN